MNLSSKNKVAIFVFSVVLLIIIMYYGDYGYYYPRYLYRTFTTRELPKEVTEFHGEGHLALPVLGSSSGIFSYKADSTYLDWISDIDTGINATPSNPRIHRVSCDDQIRPLSLSEIVKGENTNTVNKICFMGVVFLYAHYLIYDPLTGDINHFVIGLQE